MFDLKPYFSKSTFYDNYPSILKARRKNQRAKSQRRGCPTAGCSGHFINAFRYVSGTYINKARDIKRGVNWKHERKMMKKAIRKSRSVASV